MKKIMIAFAAIALACVANAASVGWSAAGLSAYAGDAYKFFVIGQNGVSDISTITALLDEGTSVDSYAFGSGTVAANGNAAVAFGSSGKTLDAGTYTSFMVLFDSAAPTVGDNYLLIANGANQTKSFTSTAASVTFVAGNVSSLANDSANWKSFGSAGPVVPEPTSGLLLLLGMAGLALKRKVA